jgi:3-phenylpropionate/trans-cinnamate dioxygenase alpha subunit
MTSTISAFTDEEQTLVDRSIFTDQGIARAELARVFTRSWLFLAHEGQFQRAGDFFNTFMGADPILVTRQRDGSYKALLNSCRHRGMLVCRTDRGNAKAFTCPYHGWAYDPDGSLTVIPEQEAAYGEFDKSRWGLVEVPRVESYKGLIFATWDLDLPPLVEYLGDMAPYLDVLLDADGDGVEVATGVHKWRLDGNWKLAAEQFGGDMYHAGFTHLSALIAEAADLPDAEPMPMLGFQVAMPEGHALGGFDAWNYASLAPEAADWMTAWAERLASRVGEPMASRALIHGTVFPNFSLLWNRWNIRVWHPKGANQMDCWSWALLPRNAPLAVRRQLLLDYQRHFSPAGTWEQDDGEQWAFSARGEGFVSSTVPLNYQMGAGRTGRKVDGMPGRLDSVFSETGQRAFYRRWTELMSTPHPREGARGSIGREASDTWTEVSA